MPGFFATIAGGAGFGLLIRMWQLGIQRRNVFDSECFFLLNDYACTRFC
jgi:hypothetical protein